MRFVEWVFRVSSWLSRGRNWLNRGCSWLGWGSVWLLCPPLLCLLRSLPLVLRLGARPGPWKPDAEVAITLAGVVRPGVEGRELAAKVLASVSGGKGVVAASAANGEGRETCTGRRGAEELLVLPVSLRRLFTIAVKLDRTALTSDCMLDGLTSSCCAAAAATAVAAGVPAVVVPGATAATVAAAALCIMADASAIRAAAVASSGCSVSL